MTRNISGGFFFKFDYESQLRDNRVIARVLREIVRMMVDFITRNGHRRATSTAQAKIERY